MRKWLLLAFSPPLLFGVFLIWASSKAVDSREFPPAAIVKYGTPSQTDPSPSGTIGIMSYNIGYASGQQNNQPLSLKREDVENHLDAMVKAVRESSPDLLLLQEVDFQSERTFRIDQLTYLARALNFPYGAYVVTWNKRYLPWPYWPLSAHYGRMVSGQAVLSRYPIEKQELLVFPKPDSNPFWYNWFYLDRIAQKLIVKRGSASLAVFNVHLEAYDPKARLDQAKGLGRWVQEEGSGEKWVAGDFNSVSRIREDLPDQEKKKLEDSGGSLRRFMELTGLQNAESEKPFLTMPSWDPIKKIDHILYDSGRFRPIKVRTVPDLIASDHLPVWAEFQALTQ